MTYFIASLTCLHCGAATPADTSTRMSNRLLPGRDVSRLHVGDVVPDFADSIAVEFVPLRPLPREGPIVLLQEWYCRSCGGRRRFAHVVFDQDGRILRIDAVPLTRAALDAAHLAYDGLAEFYQDVVGESMSVNNALRPELVERLRATLPESEHDAIY